MIKFERIKSSISDTLAGAKHWEKPAEEVSPDAQGSWSPPYSQARAINIEMTSYVLRTYCQLKNISMSLPIAKWIIAQRNANGGFSSTQVNVDSYYRPSHLINVRT